MTTSVIIPTFNRAPTLPRALDSVLAQSLPADEIIVIDDGSEDDTARMVQRDYPQIQFLQQSNQGVSAARNTGIKTAQGNWLAFLDSDDEWHPDKLQRQHDTLAQNPDMQVCHCDEIWIRNGRRVNAMKKHQKRGGHIFQHCLPLCVVSPSAVMIHCDVFNTVGLFDTSLPACEDYDLWLRICARLPVLYIDDTLITKYGGHADQLSRKHWGMDRFRVKALEKILKLNLLNKDDRNAAHNMLQKKLRILLTGARKHGNEELMQVCVGMLARHADNDMERVSHRA